MHWLNDYNAVGGGNPNPTADQAFNQAHQPPPQGMPPPMGQPAPPPQAYPQNAQPTQAPVAVDLNASIVAQALTKSIACATPEDAWKAYTTLYFKVLSWNPGEFDDSINF